MTVLPGVIVPQSMDDKLVVHALSEYTPRFGDTVIEPLEDKFWLAMMAPNVVTVRAIAVKTNAITATVGNFRFNISCFTKSTCVVSLNKHYYVLEQHKNRTTQIHNHKKPKHKKEKYDQINVFLL